MTERSIFLQALERADRRQRTDFLQQACGDNEVLRRRVEELLAAHEEAGSFLAKPAGGMAATIATGQFDTVNDELGDASLDFLQPSDKPGCLGTLGPYEVIELVGRGGMGLVLRAYDTKLNRVVATKALVPELAANAMAVKRFLREARAAAAVSHDHVVTIFAIDEASRPPFIVMEFVEGQSLQKKIDRTGALELHEILRIGLQVARGLAAAHEQGLVHRDIKPANILLENGVERVKITDFGLARAVDDASVTQTGQIAGTPQYMSPEQAQGLTLDTRSDLFSLGSVLYTMCTGRAPFRAETPLAMLRRVTDDEPRSIAEINGDIPAWLEAIVFKLLAKSPEDRFQSATEVAELLSQHLAHLQNPTKAPKPKQVLVPPPQVSSPFLALAPPAGPPGKEAKRKVGSWAWLSMAALILILLVMALPIAAGLMWFSAKSRPRIIRDSPSAETRDARVVGEEVSRPPGISARDWASTFDELRQFHGQQGAVYSVAISSDGKLLAAGSADGKARVWDVQTRRILHTFAGARTDRNLSVAFDSTGTHLAVGGGFGRLRVWDLASGELQFEAEAHQEEDPGVYQVAFSPDDSLVLTTGHDGSPKLWSFETGELLRSLQGHAGWVPDGVFTPDGRSVVTTGHDETLRLWDIAAGKEKLRFATERQVAHCLTISRDGRQLAAGMRDGSVRLFDVGSGEEVHRLLGHTDRVRDVQFTPDGRRLLSGSYDRTMRLWDLSTGNEIARVEHEKHVFNALAVTPDGRRVVTAGGVWKPEQEVNRWENDHDNTIRLWKLPVERLEQVRRFDTHGSIPIVAVALSPDDRLVAAGYMDGSLGLSNLESGNLSMVEPRHEQSVTAVAFSPDGKSLFSGSSDCTVRRWDVESGKVIRHYEGHEGWIFALDISPNGRWLATGSAWYTHEHGSRRDNSLRLWDVESGEQVRQLEWSRWPVRSLTFSPDGNSLLAGGERKTLRLLSVSSGRTRREFQPTDNVLSVAFSPDGRTVASGYAAIRRKMIPGQEPKWSDPERAAIALWDASTGRLLRRLEGHTGSIMAITFSPSGRLLASIEGGRYTISGWVDAEQNTVRVWDVVTGDEVARADLSTSPADVVFTSDGEHLITGGGSRDGLGEADLCLWRLPASMVATRQ